jgi:hypothetical protein
MFRFADTDETSLALALATGTRVEAFLALATCVVETPPASHQSEDSVLSNYLIFPKWEHVGK